jgi:hypothetical protein
MKKIKILILCMMLVIPVATANAVFNNPPEKPTIDGPPSGKAGTSYDYNFCSNDPDGDDIYYCVDWGDGSSEICVGPFPANTCVIESHTWSSDGTYTIRVKARDVYQAESDWATFSVTMPKNKMSYQMNILFEIVLQQFPFIGKILNQII